MLEEIGFIGEDTINTLPPEIDATLDPLPVSYTPFPKANVQGGLSNTTFQLYTSATVPTDKNKVMSLHQNTHANSALVTIEAAAGANKDAVLARFWQDGSHPTNDKGLPLKDMGVYEIVGFQNVRNFRIISADDFPHTIQVQYFQ